VAEYAAKQGSSAQAVYAGKTLLVRKGVPPRTRPLRFQRAQIAGVPVGNDWRIQRMYLNLNKETTKPPGYNFLQQQDRFDDFIEGYNNERPHQALGGKYPGEVYTPSLREYHHPEVPVYPFHDRTIRVPQQGGASGSEPVCSKSVTYAPGKDPN
jgi:hypothetical protein